MSALHDRHPAGHVEAGGRHRDDPAQVHVLVLGQAHRDQPAERVPHHDGPALGRELANRGTREAVVLGEDRPRVQAVCLAEAGQVECHRATAGLCQAVEHDAPGVGTIGEAVEEDHLRTLPLQLQRAGLEPRQAQPVFDKRLHSGEI
jgi:hypothetical protein